MPGSRAWTRSRNLSAIEKAAIAARCERFIAEELTPRFLPVVQPTAFNYPIALTGRWRGHRYSFITRYRSGFDDNRGEEFDHAFARLDHLPQELSRQRFDVMWHRHSGQWWRLHAAVTLDEALHIIETDGLLHPT
ncbi:hypothetical protein [Falsiroseomonas sp.]|uniref:DUF3024 domain-containing protein n=1 Tax=Falsiroseomonas sp. TaxID=2870721 RepID=UPI00356844A5